MRAFIIFMNDEPKKVILNDEKKALKETERMSDAFYASVKNICTPLSRNEHAIFYYWHLHEVEASF